MEAWRDNLTAAMNTLWTKIAAYIPNLASAVLVLVLGYIVSKLVQQAGTKLLATLAFDKVSEKVGIHSAFSKIGIKKKASEVLGVVIFWLFMLTFIISAADSLELTNVTRTIDAFVLYLPHVLGASLIFVLGLMFSGFVSNLIRNASERIGMEYATVLAKVVHTLLLVVVSVLAIGQLQIETELVQDVFNILLISGGAVLALSIGLGTRDLSKHLLSGVYLRDQFQEGSQITVENTRGVVEKIGAVSTALKLPKGSVVHLPNTRLLESVVTEERN